MSMMMSQILEFQHSRKTQKPKYFENKTVFLQIKILVLYTLRVANVRK